MHSTPGMADKCNIAPEDRKSLTSVFARQMWRMALVVLVVGGWWLLHAPQMANAAARVPFAQVTYTGGDAWMGTGSYSTAYFNSEEKDTDAMVDLATQNTRVTIKTAGVYTVDCHTQVAGGGSFNTIWAININGSQTVTQGSYWDNAGYDKRPAVHATRELAVNDYITCSGYQDSGSSKSGATRMTVICEDCIPTGAGGGATTLAGLSDVDVAGVVNGAVLKYDSGTSKWIDGSDLEGGGAGGAVSLSDEDRERFDLIWWGVWGVLGLTIVSLFAGMWHRSWRFMQE